MSFAEEQSLEDSYVMHTFGRKPVELVSGHGMTVVDDQGKEYLDFIGGIGVISLGHCHPKLVAAIQDQAAKLIHVSNYYYIENRGEVAHLLSDMLNETVPDAQRAPWQTFFANSGAEANECAIKLARIYARRKADAAGVPVPHTIVTLKNSFHGRTLETLAATAQPAKQEMFQPLPGGFLAVEPNDVEALEAVFAEQGDQICAMLLEPIQGESGVHPMTEEYMEAVRRLTEDHDALMMVDEVQCGMYRCGTYPYAFQHYGVVPDVVTMAKGIAGGVPMGACAAPASIAAAFEPGDHGSTFGGSNLAIAAARCVLETIPTEGIDENVTKVGAYLEQKLSELDGVTEVRGMGLMLAADLDEGIDAPSVVLAGLDEGLLLNYTGPHTLRFLPPLVCTAQDVDVLVERLRKLL